MDPNIEAKVCMWSCEEEIKDPTTPISLTRKFKGGWKEGLVYRWREMNFLGAVASILKSLFSPVWNMLVISDKGVTSFPSEHTEFAVSVVEKDSEAVGEEAKKLFCVFLIMQICVVPISAAALSPGLPSCFPFHRLCCPWLSCSSHM